jgi:pyruvate/2-oxoglutarate dehydrogenase complex dihydrolipoamide acyltransferase (E2) component
VATRGSDPRGGGGSSPEAEGHTAGDPRSDGLAGNLEGLPAAEEPDVLLDVPVLNVEELDLEVENLTAHVSVRAELANLVNINVGVDAHLDKVKLNIKGVEAQVQLKVRLDRILGTIDSALSALEQNPELLDSPREAQERKEIEGPVGTSAEAEQDTGDEPDEETERENGEVEATDAARRKAEELGVDLSSVEGTGQRGRILLRDVQKAAR